MTVRGYLVSGPEVVVHVKQEYPDLALIHDSGEWYFNCAERYWSSEALPEGLEQFVKRFTLHDAFYGPKRERGIYNHKTASAELERNEVKGGWNHRISFSSTRITDLVELYYQIKEGTIRPERSYDGPQGELSRQELEAKLAEASRKAESIQALVDVLEAQLAREEERRRVAIEEVVQLCAKLSATLHDHSSTLRRLATNLRMSWWPFCHKGWVACQLDAILGQTKK